MNSQDPLDDIDKIFDALLVDFQFWTHTLPDGRTIKCIYFAQKWGVTIWYNGAMLKVWDEFPAGIA
jgi:uncharacterized membrane protein YcfT